MFDSEEDRNKELSMIVDAMDTHRAMNIASSGSKQRSLASMESYMLFDDIMKDYWESDPPENERKFFFPLYLWWTLTAVIPQRPREFLLTKRNALNKGEDGSYTLSLRKNRLKGSERDIGYKIDDDYETLVIPIPENLAHSIEEYIELTSAYEDTDLETLFVTDPHYHRFGQSKHSNSRFFTYINMSTLLRYFYYDIIEGKYGLTPVYEDSF